MTILTKLNNLDKPVKQYIEQVAGGKFHAVNLHDGHGTCEEQDDVNERLLIVRRRARLVSLLCVILLLAFTLLAATAACVMLLRYVRSRQTVSGFCATEILRSNAASFLEYNSGDGPMHLRLQEHVEINPVYEYERVDVPSFGANRPAVFIHDFRQNLTAIVDGVGSQCFIKPLDGRMMRPRNFADLLKKVEAKYYEENTTVIAEQWIAYNPPMSRFALQRLNSWMIEQHCSHLRTYALHQVFLDADLFTEDKSGSEKRRRRRSAKKQRTLDSICSEFTDISDSTEPRAGVKFVEFEPKLSVREMSVVMC